MKCVYLERIMPHMAEHVECLLEFLHPLYTKDFAHFQGYNAVIKLQLPFLFCCDVAYVYTGYTHNLTAAVAATFCTVHLYLLNQFLYHVHSDIACNFLLCHARLLKSCWQPFWQHVPVHASHASI